jgi:hypothetical protein
MSDVWRAFLLCTLAVSWCSRIIRYDQWRRRPQDSGGPIDTDKCNPTAPTIFPQRHMVSFIQPDRRLFRGRIPVRRRQAASGASLMEMQRRCPAPAIEPAIRQLPGERAATAMAEPELRPGKKRPAEGGRSGSKRGMAAARRFFFAASPDCHIESPPDFC